MQAFVPFQTRNQAAQKIQQYMCAYPLQSMQASKEADCRQRWIRIAKCYLIYGETVVARNNFTRNT